MGYTKQKILNIAETEDVEFIRLQFTDLFGTLKNVAITKSQLAKALDNKIMFDGSSIEGFARIEESDMYLNPFNTVFHIRCINIHAKQLIIILQNLVCTSSHKNAWTFLCQALHCLFLRMKHLLRNRQAFFILRFF